MSTRPVAARIGVAAAAALAGLYSVGMLWRPLPNIVPAAVYLAAMLALLRGSRWGGFGGALFLLATAIGFARTEQRVSGPVGTPGNLAAVAILAAIFAALLFFAGRALPRRTGRLSPALWILLATAALAFTTTHNPFVVPTAAMENTILPGETLYFRLTGASYTPARGDIVAFRYPRDPNQIFVKRVVAIPGDRLRIRGKTLVLNNFALDEPYALHRTGFTDSFRDNFPSEPNAQLGPWAAELAANTAGDDLLVPPGKYFVLGDNRDNSLDSRYWGFIDRAAVLGKPSFVCFSVNVPGGEFSEPEQLTSPILFTPSRIRWNRLLRPVR